MNGQADRYRFGKFELIPSERRLLRDWHPVDLPPKIFDTLMVLVRAEGRAVSKRDLTEAIWPDTYVVENNLTKNISALRRLLGDDAIQTVSKFGYRLSMSGDAPPKRRVSPRLAVPLIAAVAIIVGLAAGFGRRSTDESDRIRSVVVVPLRVLRAADEQRYLADSIATAITNQLTSRRGVVVRASANSAADAIVRGTLQTNRETVQVFIEILDVRRNAIIWSRSFSAAASESPSFQANVAREVAGQLSA